MEELIKIRQLLEEKKITEKEYSELEKTINILNLPTLREGKYIARKIDPTTQVSCIKVIEITKVEKMLFDCAGGVVNYTSFDDEWGQLRNHRMGYHAFRKNYEIIEQL